MTTSHNHSPSPDPMPILAGRYRLRERLGQGAQGMTWRVDDIVHPDRTLVLKIGAVRQVDLAAAQPPGAPQRTARARGRPDTGSPEDGRVAGVIREFEILTRLHAPRIAPVYDLGFVPGEELAELGVATDIQLPAAPVPARDTERENGPLPETRSALLAPTQPGQATPEPTSAGDAVFFTRALVDGLPAARWMRDRFPGDDVDDSPSRDRAEAVVTVGLQLANALSAAHAAGVAHGDVKPDNAIVDGPAREPDVSLIDFGLGMGATAGASAVRVAGTPHYMAPELWAVLHRGAPMPDDPFALDVYALGVMLYELLTGSRPFDGSNVGEVARAHLGSRPDPVDGCDSRLAGCIARMMALEPAERPTMRHVRDELIELSSFSDAGVVDVDDDVRLPMLGRDATLDALVERILGARPACAIGVVGELGIGKSRLLDQLRWRLQRSGVKVAEMPATSLNESPWEPLVRLTRQLASDIELDVAPGALEGDETRRFNRITEQLAAAVPRSSDASAVVIWDDHGMAVPELRGWLAHVIEAWSREDGPPLCFVLSAPDGDVLPLDEGDVVELGGLSWPDVSDWARDHLRRTGAPASQLERIRATFDACHGHPMLFEEALSGRIDVHRLSGLTRRGTDGHPDLPSETTRATPLAPVVDSATGAGELLLSELEDASPTMRRLAAWIAALDRPITLREVQAAGHPVAADAPDATAAALHELARRGLLAVVPGNEPTWRFRWPFLAPDLYARLPTDEALRVFLAAARWLSDSDDADATRLSLWISAARTLGWRAEPASKTAGETRETGRPTSVDPDVASEIEAGIDATWKAALGRLRDAHANNQAVDLLVSLLELGMPRSERATAVRWLCEAAQACGRGLAALECLDAQPDADTPELGLQRVRLLSSLGRYEDASDVLERLARASVQNAEFDGDVDRGDTDGSSDAEAGRRSVDDDGPLPGALAPAARVRWAVYAGDVALRTGRYERAASLTAAGQDLLERLDGTSLEAQADEADASEVVLGVRLGMTHGLAAAFLGRANALSLLDDAQARLVRTEIRGRLAARLHTYRAIALSRAGNLDEAATAYRRAHEEAEASGLDAELPTYLLNVGVAYHRQGRLGLAREYYARGTRIATRATRTSTRANLLANQANIDIQLGRIHEARELLDDARTVLEDATLPLVSVFVDQLVADADALEGLHERALEAYLRAAGVYLEHGDAHLHAEALLKAAGEALELGRLPEAQRHVDAARGEIEAGGFSDLHALQGIIRARVMLEQGGLEALTGIEIYRKSLLHAEEGGDHLLVLRHVTPLLDALRAEGMQELELEMGELTQRAWNGVAVGLTRQLRRDFVNHLPDLPIDSGEIGAQHEASSGTRASPVGRTSGRTSQATPGRAPAGRTPARAADRPPDVLRGEPRYRAAATDGARRSRLPTLSPDDLGVQSPRLDRSVSALPPRRDQNEALVERFYRLLSLNARILNEPDLDKLLSAAMDIALDLSEAERGFLLLRDEQAGRAGEFRVAISRDIDGEPIRRPHLKVSLTIAREVARTGQVVVTGRARDDRRFEAAMSVRDMDLTSVLCVPIRHRDDVLGTLYLDHRFRSAAFDGEMARMMRAFANQLALALVGARRMQELERERRRAAEARARVEELLAEKEVALQDLETRCERLEEEVQQGRDELRTRHRFDNIIGASAAMRRVLQRVDRVIDNAVPVVVLGESGTGKELIARAIHYNGPRAERPFVAFNCGAVSAELIESELFGYVKGAFTGADRDKKGLFVAADGGTLFLDELGEMPPSMQVKLLRALQERRVRPVGHTDEIPIDVRIIAATNRDLRAMVAEGDFREDLYYRIAGVPVALPPLRERREDIPLLVRHFLEQVAEDEGIERTVSPGALDLLCRAPWPGNVRHLENVVRTGCVLSAGDVVEPEDLEPLLEAGHALGGAPGTSAAGSRRRGRETSSASPSSSAKSRRGRRPKATRLEVVEALRKAKDDRAEAARILDVSERTLYRYLARYDLH